MRIFCYDYRADADVDGNAGHELNLMQQLNLELSQKNMIFPKNCIKVSKVVGQGDMCTVYACPCTQQSHKELLHGSMYMDRIFLSQNVIIYYMHAI